MASRVEKLPFSAPAKLPGSDEYFDALTDASLAEADAEREERLGRHTSAARLRKQRDAHRERAAALAPQKPKPLDATMMDDSTLCKLLARAEAKIQTVMLELEEALDGSGYQADHVNVDTREFGSMKTEVLVSKQP